MSLCKYKNLFGKPNEGLHSYRIMNIAVVDVFMTIVAAYLLSILFNDSFVYISLALFILSILLHYVFCVDTTVNLFIKKLVSCC
jgi:hypothetical protein